MNTKRVLSLFGVSAAVILMAAMLFVPVGATSPATTACAAVHLVRSGQTAAIIAGSYGISVSELAAANSLANPNRIYVGQKLCVPIPERAGVAQAGGSGNDDSVSDRPAGKAICVTGQVIDKDHKGLAGMRVVAEIDQQPGITTETDEDGYFKFENLTPGTWTMRVIVPDSWKSITPSEFKIELSYGQIGCYQVRFKLQPLGCVIVKKTDAEGKPVPEWPITISGPIDPGAGITDENGGIVFKELVPGTYVVKEDVLYPWTPLTPESVSVEVHPAMAEDDCSTVEFVNALQDTSCIIGQKVDDQHRGIAGWTIHAKSAEGLEVEPQVTDRDGNFIFENLTLGRWTLWEDVQDGWTPVTPAEFSVMLTDKSEPPDCVSVRFKNRPPDLCAEGYKVDENGTGLPDWAVVAYAASDPATRLKTTTDSKGYYRFNGLTLGDWVFEVEHRTGWKPVESDFVKVPITPGEHCVQVPVFRNESPRGCIEGYKRDDQEVGLPGWTIFERPVDGEEFEQAQTDGTGYFRFDNLPVGKYDVWEEMQSGWAPLTPTRYAVEVTPKDEYVCERVEFVNQQIQRDICIDGYKLDKNGDVGLPGFQVTATNVASGDVLNATTDGLGYFRFGGLAPGDYEVSVSEQDGWVPVGPTKQTVSVEWPPKLACTTVKFFNAQENGKGDAEQNGQDEMQPPPPSDSSPSDSSEPDKCAAYHVVKSGDTLAKIANHYGCPMRQIAGANKIRNIDVIYLGQKLCIPNR
jgi:LysM repeat protein